LQHRDRLMHQYIGAKDGMHSSEAEMTKEMAAKRISSLIKIPRKEKVLKFGFDTHENDSYPKVHFRLCH
jgi:hypothetical protein